MKTPSPIAAYFRMEILSTLTFSIKKGEKKLAVAVIKNDDGLVLGEVKLDLWLSGNASPTSVTNEIQRLIADNDEEEEDEEGE